MNKKYYLILLVLYSLPVKSAILHTGDTYSYSFNGLYFSHLSQNIFPPNPFQPTPSIFVETGFSASFRNVPVIGFGIPNVSPVIEFDLFENNLPNQTPFFTYTYSFTQINPFSFSSFGYGVLGLPPGTWSDLEGLINIKVLQGAVSVVGDVYVSVETGGSVYSSIQSVPVPAAAWLLGSGLLGLIGVARRKVA